MKNPPQTDTDTNANSNFSLHFNYKNISEIEECTKIFQQITITQDTSRKQSNPFFNKIIHQT